MKKEVLEKTIKAGKDIGIENYMIRYCSGGRVAYHNKETSIITLKEDHVVVMSYSRNYAVADAVFDIDIIPYEDINYAKLLGLNVKNGIEISKNFGMDTMLASQLIKNSPARMDIIPGTAGMDNIKDEDGNIILPKGNVGMVTKGNI